MSDLELLHALLSPEQPNGTSPAPACSDSVPFSLQYLFSNFRDTPLESPALDMLKVVGYPSPFLQNPPASHLLHSPYINETLSPLDPVLFRNMSGIVVESPLQTPAHQACDFRIAQALNTNSFFPIQDADLNLHLVYESDNKNEGAVASMFQNYACLMTHGKDFDHLTSSGVNDVSFEELMSLAMPVQVVNCVPFSDFNPEVTPTCGVTPPSNRPHHTNSSVEHSPTSCTIPESQLPEEHHPCPYTGTCLGVVFSSLELLKSHTQKVHSNELRNLLAAVAQPSAAVSYTASEQEFSSGIPRPYKCTYPGCTRAFSQPSNLRSHICTHTGERRHRCKVDGCFSSYTTSNRLKVHMRDHSGEKPYVCDEPGCGYAAKQMCSLTQHKLKHLSFDKKQEEFIKQARTLPCSHCGRKYRNQKSLDAHCWREHGRAPTP
ncbi:hypothetical protein BJ741DRAFT_619764 [Chytriomyces cf. hyalinus JEL632]|nr:hypothetical protein BJ741DRAFT_619764 [Chytriomyces cf. hyalinus JEL632]